VNGEGEGRGESGMQLQRKKWAEKEERRGEEGSKLP
jgi:hypothetical protein